MQIDFREREAAIRLVELLISNGICKALSQKTMEDLYEEVLCNLGFGFNNGLTKGCFWHSNLSGWVIKIGYNHHVCKDYARTEYETYKAAVAQNLEYYFPFTDLLYEFEGVEFFIQERAECSEDAITSDWYEKLLTYHEENGDDLECYDIWDEVYDMRDSDKIELMFNDWALCSFLSERKIGDFHEGNFGYIGDRTVIIDFSGYAG